MRYKIKPKAVRPSIQHQSLIDAVKTAGLTVRRAFVQPHYTDCGVDIRAAWPSATLIATDKLDDVVRSKATSASSAVFDKFWVTSLYNMINGLNPRSVTGFVNAPGCNPRASITPTKFSADLFGKFDAAYLDFVTNGSSDAEGDTAAFVDRFMNAGGIIAVLAKRAMTLTDATLIRSDAVVGGVVLVFQKIEAVR